MDLNETICFCADVTAGDIKKAYDEGHTTVVQSVKQPKPEPTAAAARIVSLNCWKNLQNNSRQVKALAAHSSRTHLIGMEI